MTTSIEVKTNIFNFVKDKLSTYTQLNNKIYWEGQRKIEPLKPFFTLHMINDQSDDRTMTESQYLNEKTTMFRNMNITFCIKADGINGEIDLNDDLAFEIISKMRTQFELIDTAFFFQNSGISVNAISPIRNLTENTNGGYIYRYEFDTNLGYNDIINIVKDYGKAITLEINNETQNIIGDFGD